MVEVGVELDERGDVRAHTFDAGGVGRGVEDVGDVLRAGDSACWFLDIDNGSGKVLPVTADAEVEERCAGSRRRLRR